MGTKRRIFACVNLIIIVALSSVYFTFIHHPPAEEILRNQKSQMNGSDSDFILDPTKEHTMAEISRAAWGKWVYQNQYIPVGEVFDSSCGKARLLY